MLYQKRFVRTCFIELVCLFAVIITHFICLRNLQQFELYGGNGFRSLALAVSLFPVLSFYFGLRTVFGVRFTSLLISSTELILSYAHSLKVLHLYEPLNFSDLFQVRNLSVVIRYLNPTHFIMLTLLVIFWGLVFGLDKKNDQQFRVLRIFYSIIALLLLPTIFAPWVVLGQSPPAQWLRSFAKDKDILNSGKNGVKDVTLNGLAYHLVKSSYQRVPKSPTQQEKASFQALIEQNSEAYLRPRKIFFILCESCWKDKKNFVEYFHPLIKSGFKEFRSISPVFGGTTPSAEFEVLTGLPSRTDQLDGVIFQDYSHLMSSDSHTLPAYLKKIGYQTVAIHNYDRHFWNRHIINPKFGFQRFIGLQDMSYSGPNWPLDYILFQRALDIVRAKRDDHLFMYLITMYTHGPYENRNDFGVSDYRSRLSLSLAELKKFVDEVLKIDPESLFLVFGDHKPALSDFFVRSEIISEKNLKDYVPWDPIGDVPVFIRHRNAKKIDELTRKASGLPFFCMTQAVDQAFIRSGVPAFQFTEQNKLCLDYKNKGYSYYTNAYPDWLFFESFFSQKNMTSFKSLQSSADY